MASSLKLLGTKTAAKMLSYANETHLLSGHFVQGKHFGSLPANTQIQVFSRYTGNNTEFGCRYSGSGEEIPTTLGYTDEFRLEFPEEGTPYDSQEILEAEW